MTQIQHEDAAIISAPPAGARTGGPRIVSLDCFDVRFPTSLARHGSDAMNPDPDYSAAYAVLRTDSGGPEGNALCFTIGRGNEVVVAAIEALRPRVVGRPVGDVVTDLGGFSAELINDSQLRWLGPEKGAMHMAIGAVVNAAWDLAAKMAGKPLWRLLADMPPEQIVSLIDFRYIDDALTPDEALDILRSARDADARRLALAREAVGPDVRIAVDANQRWSVAEAITAIEALAPYEPYWVEEPTSPDEILGLAAIKSAVAPVKVAAGEHVANRVIFKQLLQAGAIDILNLDACRVAGVNENVAILLLAAKFGVPVCPHAGGVGLCEMVQHLAMFDLVAVSATSTDRVLEYVDHLHEHFTDPVRVTGGRYLAPEVPGFSATLHADSLRNFLFPDGSAWRQAKGGAT